MARRRHQRGVGRFAGDSGGGVALGRRSDRGAATLEGVILFPVMLLLIMIAVQMAVFFHARGVATAAARVGLDAARVEDATEGMGVEAARSFLDQTGGGLDVPDDAIDVNRNDATERVTVTVAGEVLTVFPSFAFAPDVSITMDAPIEQVTDE